MSDTGNKEDYRELTLEDILRMFKKRFLLFLVVIIGVVALTWVYLRYQTPIYQATVTIRMDPHSQALPEAWWAGVTGTGGSSDIDTDIELIKSRSNFEKVVQELDLVDRIFTQEQLEGIPAGGALRSDLELSAAMSLAGATTVTSVRNTRIVRISVQHPDRGLATDVANKLAEVYNEKAAETSRRDVTMRREFIESQIPHAEKKLKESADALRYFKERTGIYVLDAQARSLLDILSSYDRQYNAIMIDIEQKRAEATAYRELLDEFDSPEGLNAQEKWVNTSHTLSINPVITQLRNKLALLRIELAGLRDQYPETDARVRSKRTEISATEELIQQEIENEFIRTGEGMSLNPAYLNILSSLITSEVFVLISESTLEYIDLLRKEYQQRLNEIPSLEQQLFDFERELRIRENLYTLLLEKREEALIAEASIVGNIEIVDRALVPRSPVSPNRRLSLAIGGVLGIFLGSLGVFLTEYFDKTLKSEEDIGRVSNEPVLGRIPLVTGSKEELFIRDSPTAPQSEAVKIVAGNIAFALGEGIVVGVSSPLPLEGKTLVAANLAYSFATSGQKTLLIDLDMRRPRVEKLLGIDKKGKGLVEMISGSESITDTVLNYSENLDVIPVGKIPSNPTVILSSKKTAAMIQELRSSYDKIVVDLPPAVTTSDVVLIGKLLDGLILVARPGTTERDALKLAVSNIKSSGAKILGFVVNGVTMKTSGYYYHYYYYSQENKKKRRSKKKA